MANIKQCSTFCVCILLSITLYAQPSASVSIGAFELSPRFNLSVVDDNNIYQDPVSASRSTITIISPSVVAVFDNGVSGIQFEYGLVDGSYSSLSSEDYTDHRFDSLFGWAINSFNRLEFGSAWNSSHDMRGLDSPSQFQERNLGISLDTYNTKAFSLRYILGNPGSTLGVSLSANRYEKRYTSNRELGQTPLRDRTDMTLQGRITLRLANGVNVFGDLLDRDIDYTIDHRTTGSTDNVEASQTLGMEWEGSDQFSGSVSVGRINKRPKNKQVASFSGSRWNASLTWQPFRYSAFTVLSARVLSESSTNQANFLLDRMTELRWQHDWASRFSSEAFYRTQSARYVASTPVRSDDADIYGVAFQYDFNHRLSLVLSVDYVDQSSTYLQAIYDQTRVGLTVNAVF